MMLKGESKLEPEISPPHNVTLGYSTWTEFEEDCATSRVWGGVNFKDSVKVGGLFGKKFAVDAVEFVREKVNSGFGEDDNYYYGKTLWPSLLFV